MCRNRPMVDIQYAAAEIRRGKKRIIIKKERKKETTGQKYNGLPQEDKEKNRGQQWQRYSPIPPTSSDRNEISRGGWPSGDSSEVQISSKSDKRFRSCGGSKFALPIDLGISLYISLYYCTSRDKETCELGPRLIQCGLGRGLLQ